jgi:hypothetical protein
MEFKECNKCKENKSLDLFPKSGKYFRNKCKQCSNSENLEQKRNYREDNKYKIKQYQKKYRTVNSDKIKESDKIRNELRKDQKKKQGQIYYQENKEHIVKRNIEYERNRKEIDPSYKLLKNLRKRLRDFILQKTEKETTQILIGCTPNYFKNWLSYQFDAYMNWDNYGKYWSMDHVKPCNSFDLLNHKERLECFSWKNTRPLYISENASKHDTYNQKIKFLHEITIVSFQINEMDNPQRS